MSIVWPNHDGQYFNSCSIPSPDFWSSSLTEHTSDDQCLRSSKDTASTAKLPTLRNKRNWGSDTRWLVSGSINTACKNAGKWLCHVNYLTERGRLIIQDLYSAVSSLSMLICSLPTTYSAFKLLCNSHRK